MKYLIASDIHGSAYYTEILLKYYKQMHCDKMILLGDILYHGPRNDLPYGHDPKKVAELLNQYADQIICVLGNCEADVDAVVLHFPIIAPYFMMEVHGKLVCFTHGHLFNSNHLPTKDIILVHGHTHVPVCEEHSDHVYLNPGSIAIPKNGSYHGFMTLEDGIFSYWDDQGELKHMYEV